MARRRGKSSEVHTDTTFYTEFIQHASLSLQPHTGGLEKRYLVFAYCTKNSALLCEGTA